MKLADKNVLVKDVSGDQINPATSEDITALVGVLAELGECMQATTTKLNQLIAKVPLGMTVSSTNKLRVNLDTDSSVVNYAYYIDSASTMINKIDGPIQSRQAWQQQRSLINV